MSNFADMAYDNYLMHYRTKGSKNGYTKDPDYTPVGEKAVAKKVMRDKIDRLAEENKGKYQYYNYRFPAGYYPDWGQIDKLSEQKSRGDYAGMPSSARAAKERVSELSRLSNQASRGDYSGMPSSAKEAQARVKEERNKRILAKYNINQLSKQAARGDLGGMPSSARAAKEKADRASEISRLNAQRVRGDYAGMPSSALEAKKNTQSARIEEAKARYQKLNTPIEINRLSNQASRGDYAGMPSSALAAKERAKEKEKRERMKSQAEAKRKAEYMKSDAEARRKKEYDLKARKDEISKLSEQASRGDYAGMPSSARSGNAYVKKRLAFKEWARKEREKDARERARRNLQIDKLSRQKSRGDYAGMPSSAMAAKEKVEEEKFWKKYEKASGEKKETKRKKEWNPKATYAGGKRLMMPK